LRNNVLVILLFAACTFLLRAAACLRFTHEGMPAGPYSTDSCE
jgi:hypothetical protein